MSNFDTPVIIKEHTGSTYTITTGDYGAVHTLSLIHISEPTRPY